MRLSTLKSDSGYKPDAELRKYEVFMEGKKETFCEVADEEHGYIIRVIKVRDPYSRKVVLRRSGKLYGKVEIREIK
jgi:hypothetical protein